MKAENFDLEKYLQRIGFVGEANANLASLQQIMLRQVRAVPFENLDVQAGKIVSMVPEDIVDKIVHRRRGGYCYEVNGLFAMALEALGIDYQLLGARPMFYPTRRPKTHMVVLANLADEQWLCDTGFGSYGIAQPINLSSVGNEVQQGFDYFKLDKINQNEYVLKALVDKEWANQYSFDLNAHEFIDFMPANYMNSTHPDAIFVQKLLIAQQNEKGRKILFGDQLKSITAAGTEVRTLSAEEVKQVLAEEFGLI